MRILAVVALLALTGCTTDVIYKTVPVEVPVGIPCKVPAVATPSWATNGITPKNTLFEQVRALEAANEQHKAFEAIILSANKACQ